MEHSCGSKALGWRGQDVASPDVIGAGSGEQSPCEAEELGRHILGQVVHSVYLPVCLSTYLPTTCLSIIPPSPIVCLPMKQE